MDYLPYILIAFILFFTALQLRVIFATRRLKGRPAPPLDALLDESQRQQQRLLFYFFSEHCGPCRAMTPVVERLADRHPNIVKVDVERSPELARGFGVMATPTVILVQEGRIAKVAVGTVGERKLGTMLG